MSRSKAQNRHTSFPKNLDVELSRPQFNEEVGQFGLTLLYNGLPLQDNDPLQNLGAFDIVAVHGLQGHPVKSFTEASNGCCWLQDLLPESFPRSRIFTFGYESGVLKRQSFSIRDVAASLGHDIQVMRNQDHDVSPRPLVFIAYNLGGLVVKQLIIDAELGHLYAEVRENTAGVLFFGTPHQGSKSADLLATFLKIASLVRFNKDLISVMRTESKEAVVLNRIFVKISTSLTIISFYETLRTKTFLNSRVVVGRDSAVLGARYEYNVALHAQHRSLCKFANESDPNYTKVLHHLGLCYRPLLVKDIPPSIDQGSISRALMSSWTPNIASKIGLTSSGLLEMTSSNEGPVDFSNAQADIIAIHGLGGSPLRSWTSNKTDVMWLRDLLQVKFPECRILSYGYRTAFKGRSPDIQALASDLVANIHESRVAAKVKGVILPILPHYNHC